MDRMVIRGGVIGETGRDQLLAGEAVVVKSQRILSRRGKSRVRARVVMGASLAWVKAADVWGCALEALVLISPNEVNDIVHLVSCTTPTSVDAPK